MIKAAPRFCWEELTRQPNGGQARLPGVYGGQARLPRVYGGQAPAEAGNQLENILFFISPPKGKSNIKM